MKALRYLYILGGKEFLKKVGLSRVAPRWLGDREDLISVGGAKSKGEESWKDTRKELFDFEKRKVVAYVLEAAIHVVFSTHVYKFCGKYFLQKEGGHIGLRSTASLASLIMKVWDTAWLELMKREGIKSLLYKRYVDDSRNLLNPIAS